MRAHAHARTHHISFLSISLYFSPTNKEHSPHFSTSKLGSSASERPREGACGPAPATHHPRNRLSPLHAALLSVLSRPSTRDNNRRGCAHQKPSPVDSPPGRCVKQRGGILRAVLERLAGGLTADFKVTNRWPGPGRHIKPLRLIDAATGEIKRSRASALTKGEKI